MSWLTEPSQGSSCRCCAIQVPKAMPGALPQHGRHVLAAIPKAARAPESNGGHNALPGAPLHYGRHAAPPVAAGAEHITAARRSLSADALAHLSHIRRRAHSKALSAAMPPPAAAARRSDRDSLVAAAPAAAPTRSSPEHGTSPRGDEMPAAATSSSVAGHRASPRRERMPEAASSSSSPGRKASRRRSVGSGSSNAAWNKAGHGGFNRAQAVERNQSSARTGPPQANEPNAASKSRARSVRQPRSKETLAVDPLTVPYHQVPGYKPPRQAARQQSSPAPQSAAAGLGSAPRAHAAAGAPRAHAAETQSRQHTRSPTTQGTWARSPTARGASLRCPSVAAAANCKAVAPTSAGAATRRPASAPAQGRGGKVQKQHTEPADGAQSRSSRAAAQRPPPKGSALEQSKRSGHSANSNARTRRARADATGSWPRATTHRLDAPTSPSASRSTDRRVLQSTVEQLPFLSHLAVSLHSALSVAFRRLGRARLRLFCVMLQTRSKQRSGCLQAPPKPNSLSGCMPRRPRARRHWRAPSQRKARAPPRPSWSRAHLSPGRWNAAAAAAETVFSGAAAPIFRAFCGMQTPAAPTGSGGFSRSANARCALCSASQPCGHSGPESRLSARGTFH